MYIDKLELSQQKKNLYSACDRVNLKFLFLISLSKVLFTPIFSTFFFFISIILFYLASVLTNNIHYDTKRIISSSKGCTYVKAE